MTFKWKLGIYCCFLKNMTDRLKEAGIEELFIETVIDAILLSCTTFTFLNWILISFKRKVNSQLTLESQVSCYTGSWHLRKICFVWVLLFHCTLMSRWSKHAEIPFFYKINLGSIKLSQKYIIQIYSPDWENRAHTGKDMKSIK